MNTNQLTTYLHDHIPQSKSMGVKVIDIQQDSLTVAAPLDVNINHRNSVFGGSASSVAILSAWAFLHTRLRTLSMDATLVIQSNTMNYQAPILDDFTACASIAKSSDWDKFIKLLQRRGRARLQVNANLTCNGQVVGSLSGQFVAVKH